MRSTANVKYSLYLVCKLEGYKLLFQGNSIYTVFIYFNLRCLHLVPNSLRKVAYQNTFLDINKTKFMT